MASNWMDANLRNHVTDDSGLRISKFFQPYSFYTNLESSNIPNYKKKEMDFSDNVVYHDLNREKFIKYTDHLQEVSKAYQFVETNNYRPMHDAYKTFSKMVYLYQLLFIINNIWSITDYNTSYMDNVNFVSSSQLTEVLRSLLIENNFKNMKKLDNPDEIRKAVEKIIVDVEADYELLDIINEKIHINDYEKLSRRLNSPLITKYLNKKISELINNKKELNEELLLTTLDDLLRNINLYVNNTTSEEK